MSRKRQTELKLGDVVDELGHIKAAIAELTESEELLKAVLIRADENIINGSEYRATVSHHQRETLDIEKAVLFLTPEQLKLCTKKSDVTVVRVSAKVRAK